MAFERITVNPHQMSGLPSIRRTRITFSAAIGLPAAGLSVDDVLADYPYLERKDVLAALEYTAVAVSERELPSQTSARNSSSTPTCPMPSLSPARRRRS
jgi:uncharacterized protein (DUF433 family)